MMSFFKVSRFQDFKNPQFQKKAILSSVSGAQSDPENIQITKLPKKQIKNVQISNSGVQNVLDGTKKPFQVFNGWEEGVRRGIGWKEFQG